MERRSRRPRERYIQKNCNCTTYREKLTKNNYRAETRRENKLILPLVQMVDMWQTRHIEYWPRRVLGQNKPDRSGVLLMDQLYMVTTCERELGDLAQALRVQFPAPWRRDKPFLSLSPQGVNNPSVRSASSAGQKSNDRAKRQNAKIFTEVHLLSLYLSQGYPRPARSQVPYNSAVRCVDRVTRLVSNGNRGWD